MSARALPSRGAANAVAAGFGYDSYDRAGLYDARDEALFGGAVGDPDSAFAEMRQKLA